MDGPLRFLLTKSFLTAPHFSELLSVVDYVALSSTCHHLRRLIFCDQDFWRILVLAAHPDNRWTEMADVNNYYEVLVYAAAKGGSVQAEFNRRYVDYRLSLPVSSKHHLGFQIRLDTPGLPPTLLVVVEQIPQEEGRKMGRSVLDRRYGPSTIHKRGADGKLEIGKLKERQFKKSDDTAVFFRKDRRTNNNGFIVDDDEEEPAAPAPLHRLPTPRPPPKQLFFRFARANGATYHKWSGGFNNMETRLTCNMLDRQAPPAKMLRPLDRGMHWTRITEATCIPSRADEAHFESIVFNAREMQGCQDNFKAGRNVDVIKHMVMCIEYEMIYKLIGLSESSSLRDDDSDSE